MTQDSSDLIAQLKKACNNLLWISESEHPFEAFCWQDPTQLDLTNEQLLKLTDHSEHTIVKPVDFDSFFEVVTQPQDWYGDEEIETMKKYQQLVATLKQTLTDLKVYQVGTIELGYLYRRTNAQQKSSRVVYESDRDLDLSRPPTS